MPLTGAAEVARVGAMVVGSQALAGSEAFGFSGQTAPMPDGRKAPISLAGLKNSWSQFEC